ncbi:TusE/DsrC/DsvC family sulfur relay protein [Cellvibrio polysaccharolyticus]|uniref:Sulfurtransferase n=1 Tax=Cellvibrio polysaccharolyticus TaxID=2082724 RepID=A0A928V6U8_9GAMM|nr:TusE/DsrC/DsvC family sulfur relay protein [Cellvibrio polysaccharolyticus]MBE8717737.1 TusE/DsrC/DsvC family sulfur relay protein [Cellvibrio polysaccharolyticus]
MPDTLLTNIETDKDGFLKNLSDWSATAASDLAASEKVVLTDAHWEMIYLLQNFYREFQISPSMRALVKYTALKLGKDKGNSIYLLELFPPSPARVASKIAGLPRPANCL